MRYTEKFTINSSGVTNYYQFVCNSIHDPNYSGAGHQPLLHDQCALFYSQYVVEKARIRVHLWSEDSSTNFVSVVGVFVNDNATLETGSAVGTLIEQDRGTWKLMSHRTDVQTPVVLTADFKATDFFNKKAATDDPDIGANFGASPANKAYFTIYQQAANGEATDTPVIYGLAVIDYDVRLLKPMEITES